MSQSTDNMHSRSSSVWVESDVAIGHFFLFYSFLFNCLSIKYKNLCQYGLFYSNLSSISIMAIIRGYDGVFKTWYMEYQSCSLWQTTSPLQNFLSRYHAFAYIIFSVGRWSNMPVKQDWTITFNSSCCITAAAYGTCGILCGYYYSNYCTVYPHFITRRWAAT